MAEFLTEIPSKIKSKVIDKDWSLTFKFEEMPCNHPKEAKEFQKVDCNKCNFDNRESWLESELSKMTGNETTTQNNNTYTISKITVKRGTFDDVMGIEKEWA